MAAGNASNVQLPLSADGNARVFEGVPGSEMNEHGCIYPPFCARRCVPAPPALCWPPVRQPGHVDPCETQNCIIRHVKSRPAQPTPVDKIALSTHSCRTSLRRSEGHRFLGRSTATTLQCRLDGTEFLTTRLATAAAAVAD